MMTPPREALQMRPRDPGHWRMAVGGQVLRVGLSDEARAMAEGLSEDSRARLRVELGAAAMRWLGPSAAGPHTCRRRHEHVAGLCVTYSVDGALAKLSVHALSPMCLSSDG